MTEIFDKKVINSVLRNDDLLFDWCFAASESIDHDVADKCLEKIVNKWFSITGNSFVKNMMERYMQTSRKGQRSQSHCVVSYSLIPMKCNVKQNK